jgi:hypothetical protein
MLLLFTVINKTGSSSSYMEYMQRCAPPHDQNFDRKPTPKIKNRDPIIDARQSATKHSGRQISNNRNSRHSDTQNRQSKVTNNRNTDRNSTHINICGLYRYTYFPKEICMVRGGNIRRCSSLNPHCLLLAFSQINIGPASSLAVLARPRHVCLGMLIRDWLVPWSSLFILVTPRFSVHFM